MENTINPAGALSGSLRVNRGGGYNDFCKHLRSAYRSATNPIDGDQNLGFRICRNAEEGEGSVVTTYSLNITIPSNPRVLVAYFSYSGNTEEAARMIAEKTGADLIEITRQSGDYNRVYPESAEELKNWTKPALRNHVEDMSQYDVIILGYPTTLHGGRQLRCLSCLSSKNMISAGKPFCLFLLMEELCMGIAYPKFPNLPHCPI